jgi:alpha-D-xyloside xylohydrolase
MMSLRHFIYLFSIFCCLACQKGKFQELEDGIVVQPDPKTAGGLHLVKLQVVSDKVIHVMATGTDSFSSEKSLVAVDLKNPGVDWKATQQNDHVILSTSCIRAIVSLKTGEICFTDTMGRNLLKEKQGGGKIFRPVSVDGVSSFQISQQFESPGDEAIYGLGQHQNGIMNYKGRDEILFQYNSKVAVPFMVSNKNYGLLWDNYSLTKFGDSRDYEQLSRFRLFDPKGNEGGLTATYMDKETLGKVFTTRTEPEIDYEFLGSGKKFPGGVQLGQTKVIWSGNIQPEHSGKYKFRLYYSGYIKVWLNGKLVADRWRQSWNPTSWLWELDMECDKKYPINIEWIPDGNEAYLSVKALPAVKQEDSGLTTFTSEMGDQINYYFIYGETPDEVIAGYRAVTGRAPVMPRWAMGFWQSRERYKTQAELLSIVKEFRKKQIPIDNIVLDWFYWKEDQWGSHEFDRSRFPDPAGMVNELHNKLNAHIILSVWPKFYVGTKHYDEFNDKGWLYGKNVQNQQRDWVGKGYVSTFYDAFNPAARNLFWDQIREHLYPDDFDGWWLDATEPDILSNSSVEQRKELMNPTALGPAAKYFNAYSLMNARGIYEGQRATNPDKRVFILTRSAFAGQQRYGTVTWSGDIGTRWEDYKAQISAGLNFSLSGLPYWTMDIGGFSVERRYEHATGADLAEWRELNTRWFQFGAFCPIFRVHGQFPYREMFNLMPESSTSYKSMLFYDRLRYRLMPYIYSLAGKVYHDDYTIMRALVMDFSADRNVLTIDDQYMFGPGLMVAPVYEYKARTRNIYLPSTCGWYDIYSGTYIQGGILVQALAPLDRIPLYAREGSIVPYGPDIQFTTEKQADPITLYVYTGKDAAFDLYEDEDVNYAYEKGVFSVVPIWYNEQNRTLTIGDRKGSFPGMLARRTFNIIVVNKDKPVGLDFNNKPDKTVLYDGQKLSVNLH